MLELKNKLKELKICDSFKEEMIKIAGKLNEESKNHEIGKLQNFREEMGKNLKTNKTDKKIFTDSSIKDARTFHAGTQKNPEPLFIFGLANIDGEYNHIAYGLAFHINQIIRNESDIKIEYARKIKLFNECFRDTQDDFVGFNLWYEKLSEGSDNKIHKLYSDILEAREIPLDFIEDRRLIFFGKYTEIKNYTSELILKTFDVLFPIYKYIESNGEVNLPKEETKSNSFEPKELTNNISKTQYTQPEKTINVDLRHNDIQRSLYNKLVAKYGKESIDPESLIGNNNRVDIKVKDENGDLLYYEIKTSNSAKACIREALGQLLEYSYWTGNQEAKKLIIVGEAEYDTDAQTYIEELRDRFKLPISYEQHIVNL
ncbi:MAG: hypothetical protein WAX77_03820 [Methylococcaceae bacterium]